MTTESRPQVAGANPTASMLFALLIVIAMGVGFFGGYLVWGVRSGGIAPVVHQHAAPGQTQCQFELAAADQHLIAGMVCPGEGYVNVLLNCHCNDAHAIKNQVKRLIAEKKSPEDIRTHLVAFYGDQLISQSR